MRLQCFIYIDDSILNSTLVEVLIMEQINEILLIHTAPDTADLICKFITYSSHHDSFYDGIENALSNIEKTTKHCDECDDCKGCMECEHSENCINCNTCSHCDCYYICINIPIASVIFDWKLLFIDIIKINRSSEIGECSCNCNVIPDSIKFVLHPHWAIDMCDDCVLYVCPMCENDNHICSFNVSYNDGPVHLTLNYMGSGENIILSII